MFEKGFEKLKDRKGSSMPEAMIGFLIAVLASMVLVGVVTVSGNIMIAGEESLKKVYETQMVFDIFVHHDYEQLETPDGTTEISFQSRATGTDGKKFYSNVTTNYLPPSATNQGTVIIVTDCGVPGGTLTGSPDEAEASVSYCLSERFGIFCFTTPPGNVVK